MSRIKTDMTLKTLPGPFRAVWRGEKTAELRMNERDFQVNDRLELLEHDGQKWIHPYRRIIIRVTHIVYGGKYGLVDGCVMLSFSVIRREIGMKGAKWARCPDCSNTKAVS